MTVGQDQLGYVYHDLPNGPFLSTLPKIRTLWIVMDFESTGLNLARDRITQIAVMAYLTGGEAFDDDDSMIKSQLQYHAICCGRFSGLVRPEIPVAEDAARISGLTTAALDGQPTFEVQGARLLEWLISTLATYPDVPPVLVAHNGLRCVLSR